MPLRASDTPSRAPMPAISHFDLLGLKPEKDENLSKTYNTTFADFLSLKKRLYCQHKPNIRINCCEY